MKMKNNFIDNQIQVGSPNDCPTATTTTNNSEDSFSSPVSYGWVCPKCGRVYSPSTSMCWYCSNITNSPWTCNDSDTFLVHFSDLPTYYMNWSDTSEGGFSY